MTVWPSDRLAVFRKNKRQEKREEREERRVHAEWGDRGIDRGVRREDKNIQKGMKTNRNLSQRRVERLEEIGFQWNGRSWLFDENLNIMFMAREDALFVPMETYDTLR